MMPFAATWMHLEITVTQTDAIENSIPKIQEELAKIEAEFTAKGKNIEAQRINMRTLYDIEMLNEAGYCSGIENYSVYLDGRKHGQPPGTLIDFFPEDFLVIVDESHITLPQVRAMFNGDRARKNVLVENGFRLPSCLDNRPLQWQEFEDRMRQAVFVSATPGDYELQSSSVTAEQIIRPTGIPDPEVEVLPAQTQIDDVIDKLRENVKKGERSLVLTLTKKASEDLADYLRELKFRVKYIHSELNTFERAELIRDLRAGKIDVLVGINLLREGMDLPEVTFVCGPEPPLSARSLAERRGTALSGTACTSAPGSIHTSIRRHSDARSSHGLLHTRIPSPPARSAHPVRRNNQPDDKLFRSAPRSCPYIPGRFQEPRHRSG